MTLAELIGAFRVRINDDVQPYLWGETEVTEYLNEAQNEAVERALLIQDETTAADAATLPLCTLALVANTATYAVSPLILRIERATLASTGDLLVITSREALDKKWPGWETVTGTPQYLFENGNGNVTVVPTPTVNDSVSLVVKRLPLARMKDAADLAEIPSYHQYRMIDWALRLAYLKPDADTHDPNAAAAYEAEFERSFGYRKDANVRRKQRERRPAITRSAW